jgi:hypothetical protein
MAVGGCPTFGSVQETSATRLRLFGSSNGMVVSLKVTVARDAPPSRSFFVSMRVSMPYSAGTFSSFSHSDSDVLESQCEWWCE